MLDHELIPVRLDVDRGGRHQLGIQGVELIGILIRPQREPGGATDHIERMLKCRHHVHPGKPVFLTLKSGGVSLLNHLKRFIFVHAAIIGKRKPRASDYSGLNPT